jgi:cytochrome c biogenesis protein CcmG/thiol:disulfide interchange protein DsbE
MSDSPTGTETDPGADPERRRRVAPFVALAVAIVFAALFVVLAGSDASPTDTVDSFLIDQPAPAAVGTTLADEPFDLSRRKGSWVVLNFFDPECVECVKEHPELVAFVADQLAIADGAELYTIVNQGSDGEVAAFFATSGGGWPVVRDPDGTISVDFGVSKIPETWIVDPEGIVRARFAGAITSAQLSTTLQQLREQRG